MAKKTIHMLIDDLDGESEATGTVRFGVDGTSYEIDLTDDHQARLREIMQPFCEAGTRLGRVTQTGERITRTGLKSYEFEQQRVRNGLVRGWFAGLSAAARESLGLPDRLADRGRIPDSIVQAYDKRSTIGTAARVAAAEKPTEKPAEKPVEAPKPNAAAFGLPPVRKTGKAAPRATTVEVETATKPAKRTSRRGAKAEANSTK